MGLNTENWRGVRKKKGMFLREKVNDVDVHVNVSNDRLWGLKRYFLNYAYSLSVFSYKEIIQ